MKAPGYCPEGGIGYPCKGGLDKGIVYIEGGEAHWDAKYQGVFICKGEGLSQSSVPICLNIRQKSVQIGFYMLI